MPSSTTPSLRTSPQSPDSTSSRSERPAPAPSLAPGIPVAKQHGIRGTDELRKAGSAVRLQELGTLGKGDERAYSSLSTLESTDNLIEPLFPNSLVPTGPGNFD